MADDFGFGFSGDRWLAQFDGAVLRRSTRKTVAMVGLVATVRDADVIIANPTHISIALRYRAQGAPVVLAKRFDEVARSMQKSAAEAKATGIEFVYRRTSRGVRKSGAITNPKMFPHSTSLKGPCFRPTIARSISLSKNVQRSAERSTGTSNITCSIFAK
jgi:hypothetical protein